MQHGRLSFFHNFCRHASGLKNSQILHRFLHQIAKIKIMQVLFLDIWVALTYMGVTVTPPYNVEILKRSRAVSNLIR